MQIIFKRRILSHVQGEKYCRSQRDKAQNPVHNVHNHILLVALGGQEEQANDKPGNPHAPSMILKLV